MRSRLLGITITLLLAYVAHLGTKALLAQSRRSSVQAETRAGQKVGRARTTQTSTTAQPPEGVANPCNPICSWVRIEDIRVDSNVQGAVNIKVGLRAWQGTRHDGVRGDYVAQIDVFGTNEPLGSRGTVASVCSRPMMTARGQLRTEEVSTQLLMPPGAYKAHVKLVGINAEWSQNSFGGEMIGEFPVHCLRTIEFSVH
jgi:hypothetical protein